MGCPGGTRGQSAVVGYVLVIGLSLAVVGVVVAVGAVAIADVEESAQANQAESAMTQFDSNAAEVALGESPRKSIRLGQHGGSGDVHVEEDAGEITVEWTPQNESDSVRIAEETLGKVVYESGDRTIAYQGGGVWRAENGWSKMVSPPEYHYRDQTLTFPIIKIEGDTSGASPGDQFTVRESGFERQFPNDTHSNPLEGGHVHVRVTSDYHHGWKQFFETRTEGSVTHYPDNRTVWVNLTVPFEESFENGVATTADGPNAVDPGNGAGSDFENPKVGVDRPSASPVIEQRIDDCEAGGCDDLSSTVTGTLATGTYYADEDVNLDGVEYDTTSGDVDIVVDGDVEFTGDSHTITGDENVTFYLNGSMTIGGSTEVNTGGNSSDLMVLVHSEGGNVTTAHGTPKFTGLLYAPNSDLEIKGGGSPWDDNIVGAAVVKSASANGTGSLRHDVDEEVDLPIEFDTISYITYLHVTENRIEVTTGED
ncbi:hypothetical protein RH858_00465 [Halalkaliarchaeum sp. AArc-GB]|uniref:DUF7289 family protein n=1 Tax=Halalkaliarchaeum sp. AArc-GB TaxID=3074078 RepID=UPI002864C5FA|nr:hypothetical protein [Halalkaliarchaeum sp. AArc-GB]MDR5671628.1 hypothetical protein [Halalkaliarchaeum sp. AArc-GB]